MLRRGIYVALAKKGEGQRTDTGAFTMRTLSILSAAAAMLGATTASADPAQRTFSRDGRTYTYTQTVRDDGTTVIEGREVATAGKFRLTVANGRVTGISNGRPVSFRAPAAGTAMLAAN